MISHKKFAAVATKAATMHGISSQQIYTLGGEDSSSSLRTIEYECILLL